MNSCHVSPSVDQQQLFLICFRYMWYKLNELRLIDRLDLSIWKYNKPSYIENMQLSTYAEK